MRMQGALGRFINHSCEPNCETQKWVVQGSEIAIGLFTTKAIPANTELTFDYNFERYGDKVAVCLLALLEHASAQSMQHVMFVVNAAKQLLQDKTAPDGLCAAMHKRFAARPCCEYASCMFRACLMQQLSA